MKKFLLIIKFILFYTLYSLAQITIIATSIPDNTPEEDSIFIVGDFNNWNTNEIMMKKLKDGSFSTSINLKSGTEYQFRY